MSKLNKSEKILIGILLLAVSFYVYYTFLLNPILNKISASNESIRNSNIALQNFAVKETQIKSLEKQYDDLKVKYDEVANKYPEFEKAPQIAYDIKAIANKNSIVLTKVDFGDMAKVEKQNTTKNEKSANSDNSSKVITTSSELYTTLVTINITGTYDSIKGFIKDLEYQKRADQIVVTTMFRKDKNITATISSNFYFITGNKNNSPNTYDFNKGTYGKAELFN